MKNQKVIVIHISAKHCKAFRAIVPRKCGETDKTLSRSACGGPASVSEHVMTKPDDTKVEPVKTCFLAQALQKFRGF